jgi:hypothetical protein
MVLVLRPAARPALVVDERRGGPIDDGEQEIDEGSEHAPPQQPSNSFLGLLLACAVVLGNGVLHALLGWIVSKLA